MEFDNSGGSVYHKTQALYTRSLNGDLKRITGPNQQHIQATWQNIKSRLPKKVGKICTGPQILTLNGSVGTHNDEMVAFEMQREGVIVGLILRDTVEAAQDPFQRSFVYLVLAQIRLHTGYTVEEPVLGVSERDSTNDIVDHFDEYLRHESTKDQWAHGGRTYFEDQVRHFTSRNCKVEFCLPAFPCKSSNPNKVMGTLPDSGEEMALKRLHGFVRGIEAIYQPGAKVWIISDGHVFSDCIGVNDDMVDKYTASLVRMNDEISAGEGHRDRVGFKSLVDLFDLNGLGSSISDTEIPGIDHFLNTKMTKEAELSREVLMSGCQSDKANLRRRIDSQEPSILALYRGFSRFMLEDLDLHPYTAAMSRSQRKKLAIKVSFEMIMRNQAYSNLVELLFPDHVRLSIHAHTNSGPKFGIRLFDKQLVKTVRSLEECTETEGTSCDLLHIPTPWHNCVFQFQDSSITYIAKSKIVHDALAAGIVKGAWMEHAGRGGAFELERLPTATYDGPQTNLDSASLDVVQNSSSPIPVRTSIRIGRLFSKIGAWSRYFYTLGSIGITSLRRWAHIWTMPRTRGR